jgi:hypothetical protein
MVTRGGRALHYLIDGVSPQRHSAARDLADALGCMVNPRGGPEFGVATHDEALAAPQQWREPRLVFVNSTVRQRGQRSSAPSRSPHAFACTDLQRDPKNTQLAQPGRWPGA